MRILRKICLLVISFCFPEGVYGFNTPTSSLRSVTGVWSATASKLSHANEIWIGQQRQQHGSSSSTTALLYSPEAELAMQAAEASSPISSFLKSPELWTTLLMATIILLLYIWEEGEEWAKQAVPPTLRPVLDSMVGEIGALGFIGLFLGLSVIHGPLGPIVNKASEDLFQDKQLLLELFENLHHQFFVAAIAFFIVNGITVWRTVAKIECIQDVSSAVFDLNGDGYVGLDELAAFLNVDSLVVDADGDGKLDEKEIEGALRNAKPPSIWDEVFASPDEVRAESLVVRERFIQTCRVDKSFAIEEYFIPIYGRNLEELVELAPKAYFLFIPWVALQQSIDIPRHIVTPNSPQAAAACGYFLSTPSFFWVSAISTIIILLWGAWNYFKIIEIKEMLVPVLVRDSNHAGGEVLLPPRYENEEFLREHEKRTSPFIVNYIERIWAKPPTNSHERLFGTAGAAGPKLYRNSIKYHTWMVTAQIVFWLPQIVLRDFQAYTNGWEIGNPDMLVPELAFFGCFILLAAAQLLFAPTAFLTYSLITSIEQLTDETFAQDACDVTAIMFDEEFTSTAERKTFSAIMESKANAIAEDPPKTEATYRRPLIDSTVNTRSRYLATSEIAGPTNGEVIPEDPTTLKTVELNGNTGAEYLPEANGGKKRRWLRKMIGKSS